MADNKDKSIFSEKNTYEITAVKVHLYFEKWPMTDGLVWWWW